VRSRYLVREEYQAHFVTSTIVDWLPVFTTSDCCDIVTEAFDYCRKHKELKLYGWVIMPNHFHAVVQATELSRVMADLKKFTARRLIEQLEIERKEWLLKILRDFRLPHKHESTYQVWQEGFHPQALYSDETISQKLQYLQNNPVRAGFVAAPEHWRYSSAHEWCDGAIPVMRCDDWRQMRGEERNRVSGEKAVPKQSLGTRDEKRTGTATRRSS
jgi:REP element-mobilizing transposase RayT